MLDIFQKAQEAASFVKSKIKDLPKICLGLGTGSSDLLNQVEILHKIPYAEIPHFPKSTVESHVNDLCIAKINGVLIYILGGRQHYYEGWSMEELTFPIRVIQALKVNVVLLSNATGALVPGISAGDVCLVRDHINLLPEHPLRGKNDERLGLRFPDMANAYDQKLRVLVKEQNPEIKEVVYVCLQGPSLETPAEYKMLNILGADLVGMSTVPEVIVANHAGMRVLVLSIATNVCYPPESISETTLEEVISVANNSAPQLTKIIEQLLPKIQF